MAPIKSSGSRKSRGSVARLGKQSSAPADDSKKKGGEATNPQAQPVSPQLHRQDTHRQDTQRHDQMTFLNTPRRTPLRVIVEIDNTALPDDRKFSPKSPSPLGDVFMGPPTSVEKKKRSHRSFSDVARRRTLALARVDEIGPRRNHHSLDSAQVRQAASHAALLEPESSRSSENLKAALDPEIGDDDHDEEDESEDEDTSDESLSASEDESREIQMTAQERQTRAERRLTRDLVRRFSAVPRPSLLFGLPADGKRFAELSPGVPSVSSEARLASPRCTRGALIIQRTWRKFQWTQKRRRACITIQRAFRRALSSAQSTPAHDSSDHTDDKKQVLRPDSDQSYEALRPSLQKSDPGVICTPDQIKKETPPRRSVSEEKRAPRPKTLKLGTHLQNNVSKASSTFGANHARAQVTSSSKIPTPAGNFTRREPTAKTTNRNASYLSATASSLSKGRVDSVRTSANSAQTNLRQPLIQSRVPKPTIRNEKSIGTSIDGSARSIHAQGLSKPRSAIIAAKPSRMENEKRSSLKPLMSATRSNDGTKMSSSYSRKNLIRPHLISAGKTYGQDPSHRRDDIMSKTDAAMGPEAVVHDATSPPKGPPAQSTALGISSPKLPPIMSPRLKSKTSSPATNAAPTASATPKAARIVALSPIETKENQPVPSSSAVLRSKAEAIPKSDFSATRRRVGLGILSLNNGHSPSPRKRAPVGPIPARQALGVPGGIGSGGTLSRAFSPLKQSQSSHNDLRATGASPSAFHRPSQSSASADVTPKEASSHGGTPYGGMSLAERLNLAGMQARKAIGKERLTPSSAAIGGALRPAPRSAVRPEDAAHTFASSSSCAYKTFPPLSAAQLHKITRANTERNGFCHTKYEVFVVRKDCLRPPSPSTRISKAFGRMNSYSAVGREARAKRRATTRDDDQDGINERDDEEDENANTSDEEDDMHLRAPPATALDGAKQAHVLGAGETEIYSAPASRLADAKKKTVNWSKTLVIPIHKLNSPSTVRVKERGLRRLILTPCVSASGKTTLDPLGNHLQALEGFSPTTTTDRKIRVSKFIYLGE